MKNENFKLQGGLKKVVHEPDAYHKRQATHFYSLFYTNICMKHHI